MDKLIENVAIQLFRKRGILLVGVDEIASTAGISKRTMFQKYRSKEEIIQASLEHYFGNIISELGMIEGAHNSLNYLIKIYSELIDKIFETRPVFYQSLKEKEQYQSIYDLYRTRISEKYILPTLREAHNKKLLRDDVDIQLLAYVQFQYFEEMVAEMSTVKQIDKQTILTQFIINPIRGYSSPIYDISPIQY